MESSVFYASCIISIAVITIGYLVSNAWRHAVDRRAELDYAHLKLAQDQFDHAKSFDRIDQDEESREEWE